VTIPDPIALSLLRPSWWQSPLENQAVIPWSKALDLVCILPQDHSQISSFLVVSLTLWEIKTNVEFEFEWAVKKQR
jgi:hypothetical protein